MMEITRREKRRYVRHPTEIPVFVSVQGKAKEARKKLTNISQGGLCCRSPHKLDIGQLITLSFPSLKDHRQITGRVAWSSPKNREYEIGIEFQTGDDMYNMRICEQICQIEAYRKKVKIVEGRELSSDQAAIEWINQYAGKFPT